jgi:preprotein translocase subunit YajC
MLIAKAYAAAGEAVDPVAAVNPPSTLETFGLNMLLIVILVLMFYVLLIMPQQKRFQKHREMLNALKKGDKVVTAGGLVGTVDSVNEAEGEVVIDLGNNTKVTALRSAIQSRVDRSQAA